MNTPAKGMAILEEISQEYAKFRKDDRRPAENNFDYFGEGYMAALRRYVIGEGSKKASGPTPGFVDTWNR